MLLDLDYYVRRNASYEAWWERFVVYLETQLPQTRGAWVLTGSRSFGLAYPESDIEGAVLCAPQEQEALHDDLVRHFEADGRVVTRTTTQAGLRMLVLTDVDRDDQVDIWQLEITLRAPELHELIERHIAAELSRWTAADKLAYIEAQRRDFLDRVDPEAANRYAARKGWLKVLPPKGRL